MKCDAVLGMVSECKHPPTRAPRIIVPSMTPQAPDHHHLRMMTTLHFCDGHKPAVKIADFMTGEIKAIFEAHAAAQRPIDFKPNFDKAWIDWVLTTTPEYRGWMKRRLGYEGIKALALP